MTPELPKQAKSESAKNCKNIAIRNFSVLCFLAIAANSIRGTLRLELASFGNFFGSGSAGDFRDTKGSPVLELQTATRRRKNSAKVYRLDGGPFLCFVWVADIFVSCRVPIRTLRLSPNSQHVRTNSLRRF